MERLPTLLVLFTLTALLPHHGRTANSEASPEPALSATHKEATGHSATIERDRWGVPHIHGATDADAAFGLAYAQAEDAWSIIEQSIPYYRGTAGRYFGPDAARSDYLVGWLRLWRDIEARYATDLAPATRRYIEAFAAGLNHYAQQHPEQVTLDLGPFTGKDIVAAHMLRHLLFYGFDAHVTELTGTDRARPISDRLGLGAARDPIGSNATAVAPSRSGDGATLLMINSHQPLTGPVAWYEAHLSSDEGLDVMGGLFPGAPTVGVGFTRNLAWGATVNKPDLVDTYVLTLHPEDENRYWFDGEWRTLEHEVLDIDVLIWGFIPWTVHRDSFHSVHGPVMKTDHGVYALRYAGQGEVGQVEQWLAMNKAPTLAEWREAMNQQRIASFNFVAADARGNILFLHNSLTPQRQPGWNWENYLPGDRSDLVWERYLPLEALPQMMNPPAGFIHSANQTPFLISAEGSNPDPAAYPVEAGWQTRVTNRAVRGLELFAEHTVMSWQAFIDFKHDHTYSAKYRGMTFLDQVTALAPTNDAETEALTLLKRWNRQAAIDNREAPLAICVLSAEWEAESAGAPPPPPRETLNDCIRTTRSMAGRLDPTWGDINRHGRGDTALPVAGGPDTLRAIYSKRLDGAAYRTATAGDGLYYLIRWDAQGVQEVLGVHPYGSNMTDPSSPHYLDQAADFVAERPHPVLFDAAARRAAGVTRYHITTAEPASTAPAPTEIDR